MRGGRGGGFRGRGGEASFLEVEGVWEEGFSVPSPFFLLRGCLRGVGFLWGGAGVDELVNSVEEFEMVREKMVVLWVVPCI